MRTIKPNTMKKDELLDRLNFKCSHGHNGFSHPNCYAKEKGLKERIGCLDIEASNLKANFGIVLSWAIKVIDSDVIIYDNVTEEDLKNNRYDKRIIETLCDELENFDRIVTHYGERFDVPYLRTRAFKWGLEDRFPHYGELYHTDVWKIARNKLCLHSNRQGIVGEAVQHIDIKTRIVPDIWLAMQFGSERVRRNAIAYIVDHCDNDVLQLEGNYLKLRDFAREGRTSI